MGDIRRELDKLEYDVSIENKVYNFSNKIIDLEGVYTHNLTASEASAYKGDFSKVVTEVLGYDLSVLPLLLKINNLKSPLEYDGSLVIKTLPVKTLVGYFKDNLKG